MKTILETNLGRLDGSINLHPSCKINLITPEVSDIKINDIARGLSNNPHFAGQTPEFFSVAEHCLLVCDLMEAVGINDHTLLLAGLLHDASEAYLGDMVKPLKVFLPDFQRIEKNMMRVIFKAFNLPMHSIKEIKRFDVLAQQLEYDAFYSIEKDVKAIHYYLPEVARTEFMCRYEKYMAGIIT